MDRGPWVLAIEGTLEETPPLSSFFRYNLPDFFERQRTKLWPPGWAEAFMAEAFMHKVRESDDFVKRRAKLGKRNLLKDILTREEPALGKGVPKKKE